MPNFVAVLTAALGMVCIWISVVDFKTLKISNLSNVLIAVLGCAAIQSLAPESTISHLAAAVSITGVAWLASEVAYRKVGRDVFGLGDVKLLGAGTIWVGPVSVPSVLLISSLAALVFYFCFNKARERIPFGPFLSFAIFVVWVYGPINI